MRTRGGVFTHLSRYDDVSLKPVAARLHFDELCGGSQRGECAVAVRNKTFAGRTGADAAKPPDDAECGGGAAADLPARSSNFTTNEIGKGAGFIAFDAFDRNLRRAKRREIFGNLRSSCSTIVEVATSRASFSVCALWALNARTIPSFVGLSTVPRRSLGSGRRLISPFSSRRSRRRVSPPELTRMRV